MAGLFTADEIEEKVESAFGSIKKDLDALVKTVADRRNKNRYEEAAKECKEFSREFDNISDTFTTYDKLYKTDKIEEARKISKTSFRQYIAEGKKSRVIKEAKLDWGDGIQFDTIGGCISVAIIGSEAHLGCGSTGAKVFKNQELYDLLFKADNANNQKALEKYRGQQEQIHKEIMKAADNFDREVTSIMKKYGFKQ